MGRGDSLAVHTAGAGRTRPGRTGTARATGVLVALALAPAVLGTVHTRRPDADAQRNAPSSCGRLSTRGTDIVCRDGSRFQWRGVTAFALLEQVAHGRGVDADAYMRWANATGFNLVRVLAMADILFRLTPEEGGRHLPTLLRMAGERGLYVEIVALADTARFELTAEGLREQVRGVGGVAAGHPNAVVQIANEHYHPTQASSLHDAAALRDLARLLPPEVLYTESAAAEDTAREPQGAFITRHLSRSGTPAEMIARVSLLGDLAKATGKPVVNGEPIGAAEQDDPGRRLAAPGFFGDLARGTTAAGLAGGTFHCEDCLRARIPGPLQQEGARRWVEGALLSAPSVPRSP
jgi:hypothetical protein